MPASVWRVTIRREAFGWKPPIGELAIQKRSFSGFSRCRTSTFVIFTCLAWANARSAWGVSAKRAPGGPSIVVCSSFRIVMTRSFYHPQSVTALPEKRSHGFEDQHHLHPERTDARADRQRPG